VLSGDCSSHYSAIRIAIKALAPQEKPVDPNFCISAFTP
jgi:hypothetical protein